MSENKAELQRRLQSLGTRTGEDLQKVAGKQGFADGLSRWVFLFAFIPAIFLVVQLVRYWRGGEANFLAVGWVIALALLLPVAAAWWISSQRKQKPVARVDALQRVDHELDLADRLTSADDFLARETQDGFTQAAIEDAASHLPKAESHQLRPEPVVLSRKARSAMWVIAGSTLLLIGTQVALWTHVVDLEDRDVAQVGRAGTPLGTDEESTELPPDPESRPDPQRENPDRRSPMNSGAEAQPSKPSPDMSDEVKESAGKSGTGQSAGAQSTSPASQSRSSPSSQGQSSKPEKPSTKKPKKTARPNAKDVPEPDKKKEEEEEAGSTAGRGSSKGSNKNPTTSAWKSKDQVTNEDDQEIEDDEESEDDEEEQESRGGVQPHMRDRRPPVSRDLQIGFGNRSSPDANGRGGPSEQKKIPRCGLPRFGRADSRPYQRPAGPRAHQGDPGARRAPGRKPRPFAR